MPQIEYIFSDKTGTLTSNEMQLRQIAVKGVAYGSAELRLEERPDRTGLAALRLFDPRLYKAAAKVQRSTSWSGLITAGGSRRAVMSHHTSYPNLDSAGSLGIAEEEGQDAAGACPDRATMAGRLAVRCWATVQGSAGSHEVHQIRPGYLAPSCCATAQACLLRRHGFCCRCHPLTHLPPCCPSHPHQVQATTGMRAAPRWATT